MKGRLKWKVTDVSRKCRLARSFIYESLGADKNEMLKNSLEFILLEIYGMSQDHKDYVKENSEYHGLVRCREVLMGTPELLTFYFKNRNAQDELGALIRKLENEFLENIGEKNHIKDPATLFFVRTLIHGVTLAPFLGPTEVSHVMRLLKEFLSRRPN